MKKTLAHYVLLMLCCLIPAKSSLGLENPIAQTTTTIMLDDEEVTVHFNDGDTFKILDGDRVRVSGMNTLENWGRVHYWMDNSPEYLFKLSKNATNVARNGLWHCVLLDGKDAYGRLLATCNDLAMALIKEGLGHAYSVDETVAAPEYLTAQKIAQIAGKGMWKYGVPEYIITSLHSADEGVKNTYNRLISTEDGHTEKWYHHDIYETCEVVCITDDSCMTYVPFSERYGSNRPECLVR